jgi:pimeloyl-ACP methyl ester carboxylesterase
VATCFDQLGLTDVDLAGYSMGASTALQSAAKDERVRRLVLGGIGGDPQKWGADDGRSAMRARWLAGVEAEDPDKLEDPAARRARRVFEARGNDLEAIAALLRADRRHLSPEMATAVGVPTLVVCGDRDASPIELAAALPKGESLVIEGDHESAVSNPELAAAIVRFFAD